MLAYAANRPVPGQRQSSPNVLLAIISVHVALVAVVMSAKMDLPSRLRDRPTIINLIPQVVPPKPSKPSVQQKVRSPVVKAPLGNPQHIVSIPTTPAGPATGPSIDFTKLLGTSEGAATPVEPARPTLATRHEARLLTPPSELRPPYPASKLYSEEEGSLVLKLSIDERGRVIGVEPVGSADRAFLDSARRYLMSHWRYQPATEGDRPVASTVTITLHFQLDG